MAKKRKDDKPKPSDEIHDLPPEEPIDLDSVFEDDLVDIEHDKDADGNSGVFSSVVRMDADSAVHSPSEIIRGEPLSDSVAIEPIEEIAAAHADSDVHVEAIADDDLVEVVDDEDDGVLHNEKTAPLSAGEVALPESAIREERIAEDDAIDIGELDAGVVDSSVSLKSFKGLPARSPEKEPILDLDEPMASLESPEPVKNEPVETEATAFFDGEGSDADMIADGGSQESEAADFGDKTLASGHGFDPLVESLESGVRLDDESKPPSRAKKAAPVAPVAPPPSVEFDDLVVDDVEVEEIAPPRPSRAHAAAGIENLDASDEIDIDNLLSDETVAPIDEDAIVDETLAPTDLEAPAVVDDLEPDLEPEPEPVAAPPKRGKKAAAVTTPPAGELPYQEPKRSGGWGGVLVGVVAGLLLAIVAGAGVMYLAPGLLPSDHPRVAVTKPPVVEGNNPDVPRVAVKDEKAELAKAAEDRWLKYFKKQGDDKMPLSKDAEDVKTALADLRNAGRDAQADQIEGLIDVSEQLAAAKTNEVALKDEAKKAVDDKAKAETVIAGVTKTLVDSKQIDEKDKLDPAVIEKLVKDVADAKANVAGVDKLLGDAKVGPGEKGVEKLLIAKKDADAKLAAVAKALEDAKVTEPGAKGVEEIAANRDKLAKDRDELDQSVKSAFKELVAGNLVPADADPRKALADGAKSARLKSESPLAGPLNSLAGSLGSLTVGLGDITKGSFRQAELVAEIEFLRVRDALTPSPGKQLDRLAMILENPDEKDPRVLTEAKNLADWALADKSTATPAEKAKARWLRALVARGNGDFDAARKEAETVKDAVAAWSPRTKQAYRELLDPAAFYLPRIERLRSSENYVAALKEIDEALKALPDNPRLKAERSTVSLELLRIGKEDPKAVETIRADAEEALKNPKTFAAAAVTIGKLAESTGNAADTTKAEELYRQALKTGDPDEAQSAELRLGLGRLLLRKFAAGDGVAPPKAPAAQPKEEPKVEPKAPPKAEPKAEPKEKEARLDRAGGGSRLGIGSTMLRLLVGPTLAQADETSPELKETIDLARKVLAESKDRRSQSQAHMLLGEALTRAGRRTEGLREYAKGLQMLQPGANFLKLLDEHPAFQTTDSDLRANPILAEKHFGMGLHLYREGRPIEAESQFKQAIEYFDKDARYWYWIGLSQIEQPSRVKRESAVFSWENALRLESNGRPSTDEVNRSLERIQGPRRVLLDSYRSRSTNP